MSRDRRESVPLDAVLTGEACVVCRGREGEMEPCGVGPRGQLFRHVDCKTLQRWSVDHGPSDRGQAPRLSVEFVEPVRETQRL